MSSAKVKLPKRIEIIDITLEEDQIEVPKKTAKKRREKIADEDKVAGAMAKKTRKRITDEEKAARLAAKELDKALKQAVQEKRKAETPGQAVKFLTVLLPEAVTTRYEALGSFLVASGINSETVFNPVLDNVVSFRRDLVHKSFGDDFEVHDRIETSEEKDLILIMFPDEYIPKISAQLLGVTENDMTNYVQSLQDLFQGKKITLFFLELEKYFRKQKASRQQNFRNQVLNGGIDDVTDAQPSRKKKKNDLPLVTQQEVSSALVEMQITTSINFRILKDVQELGTILINFAKAVADAPYKNRKQQDGLDWFALSGSGNIKVDKEGNGLRMLWVDQLMQFNNVGIDIAQAIAHKYPSPTLLLNAYHQAYTMQERLELLKDLPVRVGIGPLAKTRKVGPEISKRVYRFFTCTTGDRSLSHSHDV